MWMCWWDFFPLCLSASEVLRFPSLRICARVQKLRESAPARLVVVSSSRHKSGSTIGPEVRLALLLVHAAECGYFGGKGWGGWMGGWVDGKRVVPVLEGRGRLLFGAFG